MLPALLLKLVKGQLRLAYLLPFVVSMTAFIIAMMCTLAGRNTGVLEEMAVIRVCSTISSPFVSPELSI